LVTWAKFRTSILIVGNGHGEKRYSIYSHHSKRILLISIVVTCCGGQNITVLFEVEWMSKK
jgi:hypothetical protein